EADSRKLRRVTAVRARPAELSGPSGNALLVPDEGGGLVVRDPHGMHHPGKLPVSAGRWPLSSRKDSTMYLIRERFFALGQDSDITDEHGRPVLQVDGKVLSLRNRFVLRDRQGREL